MCRNRRDRRKSTGQVFFITARVRKGLPFVARESVNRVLLGIFARAQSLFPVVICSYVVMGNHYHLLLTGHSCHISPFMNYIQGEIAKAIERLIPGIYEGRIWEGRFREQIIYSVEDVIDKMAYIYLNPVRARLVRRAVDYPGLNSYRYLKQRKYSLLCPWISSNKLKPLPEYCSTKQDVEIAKKLTQSAATTEELTIDPFAWFRSFNERLTEEAVIDRITRLIEQTEKELTGAVLGAAALKKQGLRKQFTPKFKSRTPYLICHDKVLRLSEILSYREFCQNCREAWEKIKKGIETVWPKGAYRPGMRWGPILAS